MIIQRSQESLTIKKILVKYGYTYLKWVKLLPFITNFAIYFFKGS